MGGCSTAIVEKPSSLPVFYTQSTLQSSPSRRAMIQLHLVDGSCRLFEMPESVDLKKLKEIIYQHYCDQLSPDQMILQLNEQGIVSDDELSSVDEKQVRRKVVVTQRKAEAIGEESLKKSDMITREECGEEARIKMSCGHTFSRKNLIGLIKQLIAFKKCEIRCPQINEEGQICNIRWEKEEWALQGGLTSEEVLDFQERLMKNRKKQTIKECYFCANVTKKSEIRYSKKQCEICSAAFCTICLNFWKGKDGIDCSNEKCKYISNLVFNAPKTVKLNLFSHKNYQKKEVIIPEVQACPRCGLLIKTRQGDKRVRCPCVNMNYSFCQVCLGLVQSTGAATCGTFFEYCGHQISRKRLQQNKSRK